MLQIHIAGGCRPTGTILTQLIGAHGVDVSEVEGAARVSWGVSLADDGRPSLNANAGRLNKLSQLQRLNEKGVQTVPIYTCEEALRLTNLSSPLLARSLQHKGGKDIMPVLQIEDIAPRIAAGAEFFTGYIPRRVEYRSWIYRGRHLGSYRKVLAHPEQYKYIGANWRNGFRFELIHAEELGGVPVDEAIAAVRALNLDFGAVDILVSTPTGHGLQEIPHVLEINTAPGIEGPNRQVIQSLARKISRWVELGYPRRRDNVE